MEKRDALLAHNLNNDSSRNNNNNGNSDRRSSSSSSHNNIRSNNNHNSELDTKLKNNNNSYMSSSVNKNNSNMSGSVPSSSSSSNNHGISFKIIAGINGNNFNSNDGIDFKTDNKDSTSSSSTNNNGSSTKNNSTSTNNNGSSTNNNRILNPLRKPSPSQLKPMSSLICGKRVISNDNSIKSYYNSNPAGNTCKDDTLYKNAYHNNDTNHKGIAHHHNITNGTIMDFNDSDNDDDEVMILNEVNKKIPSKIQNDYTIPSADEKVRNDRIYLAEPMDSFIVIEERKNNSLYPPSTVISKEEVRKRKFDDIDICASTDNDNNCNDSSKIFDTAIRNNFRVTSNEKSNTRREPISEELHRREKKANSRNTSSMISDFGNSINSNKRLKNSNFNDNNSNDKNNGKNSSVDVSFIDNHSSSSTNNNISSIGKNSSSSKNYDNNNNDSSDISSVGNNSSSSSSSKNHNNNSSNISSIGKNSSNSSSSKNYNDRTNTPQREEEKWNCLKCTYSNNPVYLCCEMCGVVKPKPCEILNNKNNHNNHNSSRNSFKNNNTGTDEIQYSNKTKT